MDSSASKLMSGRMEGSLLASMLCPNRRSYHEYVMGTGGGYLKGLFALYDP